MLLDSVCDFAEIRVTSRRPESREPLAERLTERLGKPVKVCASWEQTLDGADVPVEASRLTEPEPLLRKEFLRPGSFLVPYGTISALALDLLDDVDKIVVDNWRESRSGDPRFGALRFGAPVDCGAITGSAGKRSLISPALPAGAAACAAACADAIDVLRSYYRDAPRKARGTARRLVVNGWTCESDTDSHNAPQVGCDKNGIAFLTQNH